jgi:hypothetical protein
MRCIFLAEVLQCEHLQRCIIAKTRSAPVTIWIRVLLPADAPRGDKPGLA